VAAIPGWIINFSIWRLQTYLWVLKDGSKIHFMEDITAVYRMNLSFIDFHEKNSVYVKVQIDFTIPVQG
jgi:hypothetical protein